MGLKIAERRGKNAKKRAVVAVARKLAVLLHRLWVSGEVYEPLRNSQRAIRAVAQRISIRTAELERRVQVTATKSWGPTPSMRRPVDVKAHFRFLLSVSLFQFSQAASVAILPSALFL